jgi:hypothetical protein
VTSARGSAPAATTVAVERAPVPASLKAVLALDHLDRDAQLRSRAGEQGAVRSSVRDLAKTWSALRPRVVAAGGRKVAIRYDAHVRAMKRLADSSNRKALQREAVHGLDLVDSLEAVFA